MTRHRLVQNAPEVNDGGLIAADEEVLRRQRAKDRVGRGAASPALEAWLASLWADADGATHDRLRAHTSMNGPVGATASER